MLFRDQPVRPAEIQMIESFFIDSNAQLVDSTLRRFDSVWRSKLVDGELPAREDIDPVEIAELLPNVMLADVGEGENGVTVEPRLVGQHHLALSGKMPARTVVDGAAREGVLAFALLDEIVERQQPCYAMLRVNVGGNVSFEAARAVYPLSSDGTTVDRIVSVIVPYYPTGKGAIEAFMSR